MCIRDRALRTHDSDDVVEAILEIELEKAAEAAEEAATLKELRKAQMDRPPPVAMKKNAETGEMEKFESPALKDDLPQEVRATL